MTSKKPKKTPSKKATKKTPAPAAEFTEAPASTSTTPPYPGFEPYDIFQVNSEAGWTDYDTLRTAAEASYARQKVEGSRTGEYRIVSADKQTVKVPPTEDQPGKAPRQPKARPEPKPKKLSALDAAARVLQESGQPMSARELVEAMASKGYWTSPGGRTPAATLYAAITREIASKGATSRFRKTDKGRFASTTTQISEAAEPAPKAARKGRKAKPAPTSTNTPVDGTPGPESLSELFRI